MNINTMVINALTSLNLPTHANVYNGAADEYITFNYADERPVVRADDIDILDETTIQVHYFTRNNPQTNKKSNSAVIESCWIYNSKHSRNIRKRHRILPRCCLRIYRGCYRRLGRLIHGKNRIKISRVQSSD